MEDLAAIQATLQSWNYDLDILDPPSVDAMDDAPSSTSPIEKELPRKVACVRCKQIKAACNNERPCKRCIKAGLEDDCVDAVKKRPGRKTNHQRITNEIALHPHRVMAVVDGNVMFLDPFANACVCVLRHVQSTLRNDSDTPVIETSSLSEWLTNTQGITNAASILRYTYTSLMTWLITLRHHCAENNIPVHQPFFKFFANYYIFRAPQYCVDEGTQVLFAQQLGYEDSVRGASRFVIDRTSMHWASDLLGYVMWCPVGVFGCKFRHGCIESVYTNDRLSELFGYSRDDFAYISLSDNEDILMRLFHISSWGTLYTQTLICMLHRGRSQSTRGMMVRKNGEKFEAMCSSQFTYDEDGQPETVIIYVTPILDP